MYCSPNTVRGDKIENDEIGGACSAYGGEAYTGFWWENLRERGHLEDQDVDECIILRWIFRKWDVGAWTGLICFRVGAGSGHL